MNSQLLARASVALSMALVACGSDAASTFGEPAQPADAPSGVPAGSSLGEIGPKGTASACVSEVASAELAPTNLVIIYDKSGSMGDAATGFDPAMKWLPVGAGMKEFFADAYSKTLRASLQFFPLDDDTIATTCAYAYGTPKVALTSAADPAFTQAIDATRPSGGTPTLPALQGGIAYAKQIATDRPGDKTAVVLVTDGEPGFWDAAQNAFVPGCVDNDVAHAALAAKTAFEASPAVPTYVVGVGSKLDSLNAIASAGGTSAAVIVDTADPVKTKADIVSALAAIRKTEVSCDFSIPPSPAGQELDPYAVNVVLQQSDGSEKVLGYSKTCETNDGWRYDDVAQPTRILLCATACADARTASLGKVSIAYGCKTHVAVQ
ncbi:MAG: hypothetical protein QOI41_3129 [Myxococcales bacterium]|nr:hypothetical protein [Myxococcales bacterium]